MVAEVATRRMLVALNKIDLLPEAERGKSIRKAAKRLGQTLGMTKFATAAMVPVAARAAAASCSSSSSLGGEAALGSTSASGHDGATSIGIDSLKAQLVALVPDQPRSSQVRYKQARL